MNIFIVNRSPVKSARMMCDSHLNKMMLESVQIMCTCLRILFDSDKDVHLMNSLGIYLPAYQGHDCNVWVRETPLNFTWLLEHATEIEKVRTEAAGFNPHKSMRVLEEGIKSFLGEKGSAFKVAFPEQDREYYTLPYLAMDAYIKPSYGHVARPSRKKTEIDKYRADSWRAAERAYQYFVSNKVFKDGSIPTWTLNAQPQWVNRYRNQPFLEVLNNASFKN